MERLKDKVPLLILYALIGVIALALRLHQLTGSSLWMDEVISATHVENPIWRIPFALIRYDMHPPAYFMQLGFWSLLGHSDFTLLLNSVVWGLGVVAAAGVLAHRLYGSGAALIATFLIAICPGAIEYSQSLRMYSMLSFVIILTIIAYETWLGRLAGAGSPRAKTWFFVVLLLEAVLAFGHAVGFFFVFFFALYGFFRILTLPGIEAGLRKRSFWQLMIGHVVLAVLVSPVIIRSAIAPSASYAMDDASEILVQLALILFGRGSPAAPLFQVLTLVLLAAALVFALTRGERRRPIWLFLVFLPLAVNIGISATVKPVFKPWIFAYVAPLACVALAGAFLAVARVIRGGDWSRRLATLVPVAAVGVAFVAALPLYYQPQGKPNDYRSAAAYIREHAVANDAVIGVGMVAHWGLARYLAGPGWGSPLDIADLTPQLGGEKILALIPDRFRWLIGLTPRTNAIETRGITLLAGRSQSTAGAALGHPRVWVVRSLQDASKMPKVDGFPTREYCLVTTQRPKGVVVELYEKRPSCS